MAKSTKNKNKENSVIEVPEVITEDTIMEVAEQMTNEIVAPLEEKLVELQSNDEEIAEKIIKDTDKEEIIETLEEKLNVIDNLKEEIQKEINNVITKNPQIKKNNRFTYTWNGISTDF